jgi:hypothetical protein
VLPITKRRKATNPERTMTTATAPFTAALTEIAIFGSWHALYISHIAKGTWEVRNYATGEEYRVNPGAMFNIETEEFRGWHVDGSDNRSCTTDVRVAIAASMLYVHGVDVLEYRRAA